MGSLFRQLKSFTIWAVLLYLVAHIWSSCPLNKPLGYNDDADAICKYSHKYYLLAEPYVAPILQSVDAKVVAPVNKYYEESPIKPYVDEGVAKGTTLYNQHARKHVDLYTSLAKNKAERVLTAARNKVGVHARQSAAYAQTKGSELAFLTKTKSLEFAAISKEVFVTKVLPKTIEYLLYLKIEASVRATKAHYYLYEQYNLYVKPQLDAAYYKLNLDKLEPHVALFKQSWFYTNTKRLLLLLLDAGEYFYTSTREYINAFQKDKLNWKSTEEYWKIEHKKEFLKNEFNRIFNAGFKIPNYEDLDFFKKLARETEAAASTSLKEEATNAASETITEVEPTLTKYEKMLKEIRQGALDDFNTQVRKVDSETHDLIHEQLKPYLQELSKNVNSGYDEVHVMLNDINHNPNRYVTRQDMRDILAQIAANLDEQAGSIVEAFKEYEKKYSDEILRTRTSILETLEEFSESTLNAYSADIIKNGDDWKEWKNYKELKKDLIDTRDLILNSIPTPAKVEALLQELNHTLYVLVNDGKSYLAILRAKANLEFQSREKQERLAKAEAESSVEESVVVDATPAVEVPAVKESVPVEPAVIEEDQEQEQEQEEEVEKEQEEEQEESEDESVHIQ